ncbi:MAG: LysR family transcriptional regulator [Burkholderiales bacterium]|nr:LysR family transcriptional regulator [Burkholderiales bacterium]
MTGITESVSLQQLRALVAIADTGSFTIAAEQLDLSQPSISHLIRRLEDQLGQGLVVRGRRTQLTMEGRAIADTARRAIMSIDASLKNCRSTSEFKSGSVVVAAGHVSAAALLPAILRAFREQFPAIGVTVLDCSVEQIKAKLLSHEADIGLGAVFQGHDSEILTEALWGSPLDLFVREDHYLAKRDSIPAGLLSELPCIQINPLAPAWQTVNVNLELAGITPNIVHRVALLSTVIGLLQAGMGVAMLARIAAKQMPSDIRRILIVDPSLEWPISIARLAKFPLTPAAAALLACTRMVLKHSLKVN